MIYFSRHSLGNNNRFLLSDDEGIICTSSSAGFPQIFRRKGMVEVQFSMSQFTGNFYTNVT